MKKFIRKTVEKLLQKEDKETKGSFYFPPGHFYSPIPSIEEIKLREEKIFELPAEIPGIDLNVGRQLELLNIFRGFYKELPFGLQKKENMRFSYNNHSYSHSDAIFLYCMIRYLKPKRIIEVGSGHSSCVTLDTNELFFDNEISCTFIEPFPELLLSLIKNSDKEKIKVVPKMLQDVDPQIFSSLSASDILFIDSTHVSKINSDVNHIFFKILPYLKSGVYIHFHDIEYPFEYSKYWIYEGLAWNEAYMLRAFLQYNDAFSVQFFNTYLAYFHREKFLDQMPIPVEYPGASIWIKKA